MQALSPRTPSWLRRASAALLCGLTALGIVGCEESPEIKKYSAPLEKSEPSKSRLASYSKPAGWKRLVEAKKLVTAAFQMADGGDASVTITRFPGDVGGLTANVDRWRAKVGLAKSTPEELEKEVIKL